MRNRPALSLILSLIAFAATIPASAGGPTIEPVKTTPRSEFLPAPGQGTSTYFAWSQPVNRRMQVFLQVNGGPRQRISTGAVGFAGHFEPGDDRLIYQRLQRAGNKFQSDLFFYDAVGGGTTALEPTINTNAWQWGPAYGEDGSDLWVLYGENRFGSPSAPWEVKLWDPNSAVRRTLAVATFRCGCVFPGTIDYPYVSWGKGREADVWRMDLATDMKERLDLPGDRDEYASAVTDDGTTYVAQDGAGCGVNAKLFRVDPDGTATLLTVLPRGKSPYTLSAIDTGSGVDLYFDRSNCRRNQKFNIYVLRDADTAGLSVPMRLGSSSGSPAIGADRFPLGSVPPR